MCSGIRTVIVLAIVGSLAAACGGAATPTPLATPAPTPTPLATPAPTPTPLDVKAPFLAAIANPTFSAAGTITGTMAAGAIGGTITGRLTLSGSDSAYSMTISIAASAQTTDSVSIGSQAWERKSPGPWLAKETPPDRSESLAAVMAAVASVTDLGVETKSGRRLHHLQPTGGGVVPPEAFGLDNPAITNPTFTLDFFATDDGTPAVMVVTGTWTQLVAGQPTPVTMTLQYDLRDVGKPQTIDAPTDVWVRYTSKAFDYTMAHPEGWTVSSTKTEDSYLLGGQAFVYVSPQTLLADTTLATFVAELKKSYKPQFRVDPDEVVSATLGGQPAQRLTYRFTNTSGQDVTIVDVAAVYAGKGWEVFLVRPAGPGRRRTWRHSASSWPRSRSEPDPRVRTSAPAGDGGAETQSVVAIVADRLGGESPWRSWSARRGSRPVPAMGAPAPGSALDIHSGSPGGRAVGRRQGRNHGLSRASSASPCTRRGGSRRQSEPT